MVRVLIMSGYGINSEKETSYAFNVCKATVVDIVHINDLINGLKSLKDYDILVFPGGFSYGDDTGSGNALAKKVKNNLYEDILSFIHDGKLILGICNGFQVLVHLGLFNLKNRDYGNPICSIQSNDSNRFECREVFLKKISDKCIFTKGINLTNLPVSHGEGKFKCDENVLKELFDNGQVVFTYSDSNGLDAKGVYPHNPNGSLKDISGICDLTGRVFGLMPHPERRLHFTSDPFFHLKKELLKRENPSKELPKFVESNLLIFKNAVDYVKNDVFLKNVIKKNLNNVITSQTIKGFDDYEVGKVRTVHFKKRKKGEKIFMLTSDRVSVFNHVLKQSIPFKGIILNKLTEWSFNNVNDIIKTAFLKTIHPSVLVKKLCENIGVECIVRGYVWGSLAKAYEDGEKTICGLNLKDGLIRYEKLNNPIFTPTQKSEHDEPMTFKEVEEKLGEEVAQKVKEISLKLYQRGNELAQKNGFILIDTKYEFGFDENNELTLIDEANTPDSSRYCSIKEYSKFKDIKEQMNGKKYANVSEFLKNNPTLKIKEMSKQFVRDIIESKGFSYDGKGNIPDLSEKDIIETSFRYIKLYENLTGKKFKNVYENLQKSLLNIKIS